MSVVEREGRINAFIENFKQNNFVEKNACLFGYLSGSSTQVAPINVYKSTIEVLWHSNRTCKKFIAHVVEENKDLLVYGRYWRSDGSCPNRLIFYLQPQYCINT